MRYASIVRTPHQAGVVVAWRAPSSARTVSDTGARSVSRRCTRAALDAARREVAYAAAQAPARPSRSARVVRSTTHSARLWKAEGAGGGGGGGGGGGAERGGSPTDGAGDRVGVPPPPPPKAALTPDRAVTRRVEAADALRPGPEAALPPVSSPSPHQSAALPDQPPPQTPLPPLETVPPPPPPPHSPSQPGTDGNTAWKKRTTAGPLSPRYAVRPRSRRWRRSNRSKA